MIRKMRRSSTLVGNTEKHVPVLLSSLLNFVPEVQGRWLDGTLGSGGYTSALLKAGAKSVVAIDRDPTVFQHLVELKKEYKERLTLVEGVFSDLEDYGSAFDGVVFDLGVSSMQLDSPHRGFSFMCEGPLDMRMSKKGQTAGFLVNSLGERDLSNLLFQYGEERFSKRIARAIVKRRTERPFETTTDLAKVIEASVPQKRSVKKHPATLSFQALRIAVNNELNELSKGLLAAEKVLRTNGLLIVVTFHSLEDRIVKKFFKIRSGNTPKPNRFAPEPTKRLGKPTFELLTKKAIGPTKCEVAFNRRSRSAKLRIGKRTSAPLPDFSEDSSFGEFGFKGKL